MPRLDLDLIPQTNATGYPEPFDAACRAAGGASSHRQAA